MPNARCRTMALLVVALVASTAGAARPACDPAGADAAAVAAARDAIDAACPCAAAISRNSYRGCAGDVVRARVLGGALPTACRREALRHAKLSVCGRPGAAVCCRARADGRTRHRVVRAVADCTPSSQYSACVSEWQSVPTGCDATSCVPLPVCGNGTVEAGEACDPPDYLFCDSACHAITCEPPPTSCGNGTVDAGEACEPPGVAACGRDCQPAPCAAPGAGEIAVACVEAGGSVAAAGRPGGYLLAWSGRHARSTSDVLVRRLAADGAPLDSGLTVASADTPCGSAHGSVSAASDGDDHYVVWFGSGSASDLSGAFYEAMYGRWIDGGAGTGALDQLAFNVPFGSCRTGIFGPTMAGGAGPQRFAVGWRTGGACLGSLIFQNPVGRILDFGPSPAPPNVSLGFGIPTGTFPAVGSTSAASVASLGPDTLWVWHAVFATSAGGSFTPFVASVWTDAGGSTAPAILSARAASAIGRPRVAAGATTLLVAWAQSNDGGSTSREIRALRATRASGNVDPDGGLLLATVATSVTGGPDVAFDGNRWLVVWAEASGATSDLRAVAVEQDGTVVDAVPRLVATDVVAEEPAAASAADGRVLVLFARPDGTSRAVRATLVTP